MRAPIPTWTFALVVVRLGRRFLLVQESTHGQGWYLPAGRVEPGESIVTGACREAEEESGLPIVPEGILRVEHTPHPDGGARLRVFFLARPADDTPPLAAPNEHCLQARWVTLAEAAQLPLRGAEVLEILRYVEAGKPVYPLSLLCEERSGW
jgi:phosphatase NudJ